MRKDEECEQKIVSVHSKFDKPKGNSICGFTTLEDDLFVSKDYYGIKRDEIPLIFDSG